MVRDIRVFRSRSRRWPAAGKEEKEKTQLIIFCNPTKPPARVRQKWFPPMILASLEALLLKIFGFYAGSCSAPAPVPAPATVIGYLIFFPEALGAASRGRFLY